MMLMKWGDKMRRKMVVTLLVIILIAGGAWYIGFSTVNPKQQPTNDTGVRVGETSPSFTLTSLDGTKVHVGQPGKITVINFWATWCPPCLEEMPELEEFAEKNQQKINFYAVNLKESHEKVSDYMNKNKYTMPLLLDKDGFVAKQFQITAIPTTLIVDKNGIIKHRQSGAMTRNELEGIINSL
jgi:cytochrome c biogenesis protein CcmG/thiol:disulfide interchange protein DsbE